MLDGQGVPAGDEAPPPAPAVPPLALYEKLKGAMRLAALDAAAEAAGLCVGQSLSDARALVPALRVREIDRAALTAAFAGFADWHSNASPIVAVLADRAPYGDLALDITGVAHLFGGEAAMLENLLARLERLGFTARGAVAGTVGAAWALAHFAPGLVLENDPAEALAPLPVAALRLDDAQAEGLAALGLKTVGQLYGRNRKALQARFGASLLLRLDQALGHIVERPTPRLPAIDFYAERRFAEPLGLLDDVLMTAEDLAIRLAGDLERAGLGALEFHLFLYRVDHQVTALAVRAGRATRDPGHIARLFANRAERLGAEYDAGFGIDMIRLAAALTSPLDAAQGAIFAAPDGAADLDRLYDRLASRLGAGAIERLKPVNSHIPERAVAFEPVIAPTPDDPLATPPVPLPRPLRLLPRPEPIEVLMAEVPDGPPRAMIWRRVRYTFRKAQGPERIAAEWWTAASLPALTSRASKAEKPSREGPPKETAARPPHPAFGRPLPQGRGDDGTPPRLPFTSPPGERSDRASDPGEGALPQPPPFDLDAATRDYFIAEDDGGRRFWLFRQGFYAEGVEPPWFLHGFFA
jgi:protein ImuB